MYMQKDAWLSPATLSASKSSQFPRKGEVACDDRNEERGKTYNRRKK